MAHLIAICSPKSGGGGSSCAVALSRALCAKGKKVVVVDFAHAYGALQYLVDMPGVAIADCTEAVATSLPNCYVVGLASPVEDCDAWVAKWRDSSFDVVVLDLPSSFDEASALFLRADLPILLAAPEPTSLMALVRWIRLAINRHLAAASGDVGIVQEIASNSKYWEFSDIYPKLLPNQQELFVRALSSFKCAFVLNHRRDNSESLQSTALCHALGMMFGIDVGYLGAISYDDRRWFYERQLGDVSLFVREDPMVREWGDIMRNLAEHGDWISHDRDCLPTIQVQQKPRQFLRATTSVGARQAYRQLWEGYCRDHGMVSMIMKPDKVAHILTLLEAAWRRADYNDMAATMGKDSGYISGEMQAVTRCVSDSFAAVKRCDLSPSQPDAGAFLQKRRLEFQLSVLQLAIRSRVPKSVIEAIESQHVESISPPRLQAYLFEIAKVLDISFDDVKHRFGI